MRPAIPNEREANLRDGRVCRVRPILPADCGRLVEFHGRLSVNTTRLRFFSPLRHLSPEFAERLCNVDFKRRCAFVVSFPGDDAIHAVGRYEWESAHSAEVAFVVEDELQGMGIGTILLDRLADHARTRGFRRLTAVVLCENTMMLTLFRESKYLPEIHMEGSMAFVKLDIRRSSQPRGKVGIDKVA